MKPYNQKRLIGFAHINYAEDGKPIDASFKPGGFNLDSLSLERLLLLPVNTPEEAMSVAQAVVSSWFLDVGNMEVADREYSRIESEMVKCDKWPNGKPKLCEVAFYFATTSKDL